MDDCVVYHNVSLQNEVVALRKYKILERVNRGFVKSDTLIIAVFAYVACFQGIYSDS